MEVSHHQTRPEEPELDLYTVPSQSSWFVWDEIHETERVSLREFFDGSSITRTPKIYKEYRDFIINKYREEPSRRLSFTEVRKSLVGDVSFLRKAFISLENWGLINFSASPATVAGADCDEESRSRDTAKVRVTVEKGVPNGIRVASMPNSMKPISPPETTKYEPATSANGGGRAKLPPLASYSDVFSHLIRSKGVPVCGNCGERCNSGQYKYTKGDSSICVTCFETGNYGENKTKDDYSFTEGNQDSCEYGAVWTEAETLLLLDSVLKYGEDWDLVAQNLPTKTKPDCILKLIELPLGDIFGPTLTTTTTTTLNTEDSSNKDLVGDSNLPEDQENVEIKDKKDENSDEVEQNGDMVEQGPPSKRQRIDSFSGPVVGSLMEQVSRISTIVDPQIAAAAAEAAITSLCEENSWPREIFDDDFEEGDFLAKELQMGDVDVEDSETERRAVQSENPDKSTKNDDSKIPLPLRIRTAVATALGSAAARAKLLADQEEREIELLMATIISTEVKKLHCKMKNFEYLEVLMKKKRKEVEEIEDVLLSERVEVLKAAFKAGVPSWKNHSSVKP